MATLQSRGFDVSVLPQVTQVDPRLFNTSGQLIGGFQSGLGAYGGLQNIADEAVARPVRRQLQDIQLAEAQNRMLMAPIESELAALRLGEAQQQAAIPVRRVTGKRLVGGDSTPIYDDVDSGEFVVGESFTPLQNIEVGEYIGPGGVRTAFEETTDLKTGAQVRAEAEQRTASLAAANALANQRSRGRQFESTALVQLIEDAEATGDAEAAEMYRARLGRINASPGLIQPGVTAARRLETIGTNAGFTLDEVSVLGQTSDGINAMIKIGKRNELLGRGEILIPKELSLTEQESAAVAGVRGGSRRVAPVAVAEETVTVAPTNAPSAAAVEYLRKNPSLAPQFDAKYGRGAAAAALNPRG